RIGRGYEFDGDDDYITISDDPALRLNNTFTISAWANLISCPDPNQYQADIWNDLDWSNGLGIDLGFRRSGCDGDACNCAVYSFRGRHAGYMTIDMRNYYNEWVYITVAANSSHLIWYFNGELDDIDSIQANGTRTGTKYIGFGNRDINGSLDEVVVWNRTLTAKEISELYNSTKGKYAYIDQDIGCSANNTDDQDGDSVKNVYNWYVDNESITILNLPFENDGSDAGTKDYSPYGNDVTPGSGGPTWNATGGYDGFGAYKTCGVSNYCGVHTAYNELFEMDDFSGSFWTYGTTAGIFSGGANSGAATGGWVMWGYYFDYYNGTDGVRLDFNSAENRPVADEWSHVAFTFKSGGDFVYYLNGEEKYMAAVPGVGYAAGTNTRIYVGCQYNGGNCDLNSLYDDVLVFNRTLSSDQVKSIYESGLRNIKSDETSLSDRWKCEITPNDGVEDGISYNSSELPIEYLDPAPRFSDAVNVSSDFKTGSDFTANITIKDNIAIYYYIFSTNAGGSWVNTTTYVNDNETIASETATIEVTQGNQVCWYYYTEDTVGYGNTSDTYCFGTTNTVPTQDEPFIGSHNKFTAGLVGEYRFENGNSTWTYDELGRNNGTVDDATQTDEGRIGSGYEFWPDDTPGIDVSGTEYANMAELTFSAWFKAKGYGRNYNSGGIICQDYMLYGNPLSTMDGAGLYTSGSNIVWAIYGDGGNPNSSRVQTSYSYNRWYHAVGTVNSSSHQCLYVNGDLVNCIDPGFTFRVDDEGTMMIGNNIKHYANSINFNGTIDEVAIWNRSLTQKEIGELYNTSKGKYAYIDQDIGCSANNTADADSDSVKNIYNWFDDNTSIAVLNMPFEGGSTSGLPDNNGATYDYSGYSNDGTVYNATWNSTEGHDGYGAYEFGGALEPGGDAEYVLIPDSPSLRIFGDVSFSFWAKVNAEYTTQQGVLNKKSWWSDPQGYRISLYPNSNYIYYESGTNTGINSQPSGTTTIDPNVWYHYVVVQAQDNITFYKDGETVSSHETNVSAGSDSEPLYIGANYGGWFPFNGTIDDVLIFNRSISSDQVKSIYESGLRNIESDETSLSDRWKCEVIPNDGNGDGISYNSSELPILYEDPAPRFSDAVNVSSDFKTGSDFTANITIRDNIAIYYYIFSTNAGGSWVNTTTLVNDNETIASETATIEVTQGNQVCWYYYTEDTVGYGNTSDTYCFGTTNTVPTQDNPFIGSHNKFTRGLVGEWRFENSNSTWTYDETGRYNGTVTDAILTDKGRIGRGYDFDGNIDNIYISDSTGLPLGNTPRTISAWVKVRDTTYGYIFGYGEGTAWKEFSVFVDSGNLQLSRYSGNIAITSGAEVTLDKWTHVVFTFNGSDTSGYVDGSFINSISTPLIDTGTGLNTYIGRRATGSGANVVLNGSLDEVTIWNRSLTAKEIYELYNSSYGKYAYNDQDIGCSANNTDDADSDSVKN
ncbi:LamG-like jellyroll fold domain-containing protein, partial [Nanoarchaeota archaeon]